MAVFSSAPAENANGSIASEYVYVNTEDHSWVPGRLIKVEGDVAKVMIPQYRRRSSLTSRRNSLTSCGGEFTTDHALHKVSLKDYPNHQLPIQNVNEETGLVNTVDDMLTLPHLHEVSSSCREALQEMKLKYESSLQPFIHGTLSACSFVQSQSPLFVRETVHAGW
jgi:hypothetical protein